MKKIFVIILLASGVLLGGCSNGEPDSFKEINSDQKVVLSQINTKIQSDELKNERPSDNPPESQAVQELPESVQIKVPFSPQAPFANWDDDHNEGCEEASILLANEFIKGNQSGDLDKSYADFQITQMIAWQRENWGGHFDLEMEKTKELAEKFYNINNLEIVSINSIDDLKYHLVQGKIIIAPTAGRELGNPNFKSPGPVYHMLVIKGYNSKNFVTNDVGTRKGKDYEYRSEVLYNAIHDLPDEAHDKEHYIKDHSELIKQGAKKVLVVSK